MDAKYVIVKKISKEVLTAHGVKEVQIISMTGLLKNNFDISKFITGHRGLGNKSKEIALRFTDE